MVGVTVRLTVASCVDPIGVTVIGVEPDAAMSACVVMVRSTVAVGFAVVRVKLVGLPGMLGLVKVQPAPAGSPAQLPVLVPVEETMLFLKLTVALVPPANVRVNVVVADCPAGMERLAGRVPGARVKSPDDVPAQARTRLLASTEPRPVTKS